MSSVTITDGVLGRPKLFDVSIDVSERLGGDVDGHCWMCTSSAMVLLPAED